MGRVETDENRAATLGGWFRAAMTVSPSPFF